MTSFFIFNPDLVLPHFHLLLNSIRGSVSYFSMLINVYSYKSKNGRETYKELELYTILAYLIM